VPGAELDEPLRPAEPIPVAARRTAPPAVSNGKGEAHATQPLLPLPPPPARTSPFKLPPIDLLNPAPAESPVDERELIERARHITDKFREFSVDGQVVQIHPGPVVTVYEFKPEAGVKYSRILSLIDDLCLALKAESIRVDRIPGKSTVGIEVPNRVKETIFLRDVIGGTAWAASRSRLTLGLGKTLDGEPFVADLERMPHLLIAGSTGSGKSVGLNCMITSILYKATPEEVRFIFIDPKMLELGVYDDIPHLLVPVVTDMKKAAVSLKWAVREMETRYKTLATTGVRNIEQFNALVTREPGRTKRNERTGAEEVLTPIPYIVIVIDELADLMMVASVDVEESITRLAQMARAVGIHLVLATQRPSVDVITGIIKANFPARIAYRVSQKVDSRTILDTSGAETLLGHGDLLFLPPGSSRLLRVHGALVTEAETHAIVKFLKDQGKPAYNTSVLKEPEEEREGFEAEKDEMYEQAVRLVISSGQASISHLQRRLRLGYARAARIVDMMEDEGVIGPGDGAKPREVLVGSDFLERLDQIAVEESP
jgi:S-DNA-T family DNA segregation ATPase FtsK/SpoIIIE